MSIYDLTNRFWQENHDEPFSVSEVALYYYLLYRANMRRWRMPIRCPTSMICIELKTTKQNVVKAREGLVKRGFISVIPGKGTSVAPEYTIHVEPPRLSGELSHQLSGQLTIYKTKDEDLHHNNRACEGKVSLNELEQRLSADAEWLESVRSLLSKKSVVTLEEVATQLREFFSYLRCHGFEEREEKDCRGHFLNWLNKQIKRKNGTIRKQPDKRRESAVTARTAQEYEGAF